MKNSISTQSYEIKDISDFENKISEYCKKEKIYFDSSNIQNFILLLEIYKSYNELFDYMFLPDFIVIILSNFHNSRFNNSDYELPLKGTEDRDRQQIAFTKSEISSEFFVIRMLLKAITHHFYLNQEIVMNWNEREVNNE